MSMRHVVHNSVASGLRASGLRASGLRDMPRPNPDTRDALHPCSQPYSSRNNVIPSSLNKTGPSIAAAAKAAMVRRHILDGLQRRIALIERPAAQLDGPLTSARSVYGRPGNIAPAHSSTHWRLGLASADHAMIAGQALAAELDLPLDTTAVHELKPSANGDGPLAARWMAARMFALALASRLDGFRPDHDYKTRADERLDAAAAVTPSELKSHTADATIFWCTTRACAAELGACYGPGLASFGINPSRLVVIETGRAADVLWALEEVIGSGTARLAIGLVDEVAPTPARRLALAASRHATPCLLLTAPNTPPALSMSTRWRLAPAPGAPHPFDPRGVGALRIAARLERCRARPLTLSDHTIFLEWCDASFRFRLAAGAPDRAAGAHQARHSAG